jgi:GH24 family phage-related lysozyme (muramidase)
MPFKSEAQRKWMHATHPEMARKWEKHTPKGRRLPKKLHPEKSVGLPEDVAILFPPVTEGEYPWTKRASYASAGMLLGLLAARTLGHKGDYVLPPRPPPVQEQPKGAIPSPPEPEPAPEAVPVDKVFQKESLSLQEVKDFIAPSEGSRSKSYNDSRGNRTVGVGINLDAPDAAKLLRGLGVNYTAVKSGQRRLSADEIDYLFTRKVQDAMAAGQRVLQSWDEHPKQVQLAVTDMIYNLGPTGFKNMDRAVGALERKNYSRAANYLEQSRWYQQVGGRAEKVVALIRSADDVAAVDRPMANAVESTFGRF